MATLTVISRSIDLQELSGLPRSSRSRSPRLNHISEPVIEPPIADGEEQSPSASQHLPPVDRGAGAYKLLFGAFVFEALLWGKRWAYAGTSCSCSLLTHDLGFPLSYGVFQDYYFEHEPFRGNKNISVVGTVATGISYLGAPLISPIVKRYHRYQRHMIWIGWPTCIMALIAGSFARTIETLILTQGVLYGIGILLIYYPLLSMLNEWFVQKRGLAYGILYCATGLTGTAIPFVMEILLRRYGYEITLRATAVGLAVSTGPLLPMLKGRLPIIQDSAVPKTDWSFLKKPLFYLFATSTLFQGMAWFIPLIFLPSFSTSIGFDPSKGALLLALVSLSQLFGQIAFGWLSDYRLPLHFLMFLSPCACAIGTFTLWGLAHSLPPLIIFALIYGGFGGGFVVLWARMGTALSTDPTAALAAFSIFAFEKGVGNVLAGPLSAVLITQTTDASNYGVLRYKGIVIFTGACMLLSSLSVVAWYLKPRTLLDRSP